MRSSPPPPSRLLALAASLVALVATSVSPAGPTATTIRARAWPHPSTLDEYPEAALLRHKRDVGVSFSGGGSRSYAATLGYLRGLLDLDLLKDVKYASSVSGGTWALVPTVFRDPLFTRNTLGEFLGEPTPPDEITLRSSRRVPPANCARSFPVRRNILAIVTEELLLLGTDPTDVWVKAVHQVFLAPAGIGMRAVPAWTRAQAASMLAANPHLAESLDVALPCGGGSPDCPLPFPVINTAMLGPIEAAPFGLLQRRYVMMDVTPVAVGFPLALNVSYPNTDVSVSLGGLVEPIGFGARPPDFCGLAACPPPERDADGTALLRLPTVEFPFALANASAASSWAPGSVVSEEPLLKPLDNVLLTAPYFSPLWGGGARELFLADGDSIDNQGFISLLQRRVRRVVAFINTATPLAARERYNPHLREPLVSDDVDESLCSLFGIRGLLPPVGEDLGHGKVFSSWAFPRVVDELQRAQKAGKGAVASFDLVTVRNRWWGIEAGHRVHVTFVYLGRVYEWEDKLDHRVAAVVAPHRGLQNPARLPENGTFQDFPHPSIAQMRLSPGMANMMSDLAWYVVTSNARVFERAVWGPWGGGLDDDDVVVRARGDEEVGREGDVVAVGDDDAPLLALD